MNDLKNNPAIGDSWEDFRKEIYTAEEIAQCDAAVAIFGAIKQERQEQKFSQRDVAAISGVQQPVIARMEKGSTKSQLETVLKVLNALGMTLKVVPLEEENQKAGA